MKHKAICLFMGVVAFWSCHERKTKGQLEVLKSNQNQVNVKVGDHSNQAWGIDPNLSPDRMHIDTENGTPIKVQFASTIDTAIFYVNLHDTVNFHIHVSNMAPAHTQLVGVPKNVNFTLDYIKANQGKLRVEIPEVHELAKIMVAISNVGMIDSNMTEMRTSYHKDVLNHFEPFKDHAAISEINRNIKEQFDESGYWYYYALKMNACGYFFNEKGEIIDDGVIHNMGFNSPRNPFINNLEVFEDFAKTSNFRDFYKEYEPYYKELIKTYKSLNPIRQMQQWLENKFGFTYGSYAVYFSPLSGGAHSAQKFEDNGFKLSVMFVQPSEKNPKYSEAINEMKSSRVVFTEIDHNFVNPVSDTFIDDINNAFEERDKWVFKNPFNENYKNAYAIFNEYMTWGVFSLYCLDFFEEDEVATFLDLMEDQMESRRGFIQFRKFNRKLIQIYRSDPSVSMNSLFQEILDWSKSQ